MKQLQISTYIEDCLDWHLDELLLEFDGIIESIIYGDAPSNMAKNELELWRHKVIIKLDEIADDASAQLEAKLRIEETIINNTFGTES